MTELTICDDEGVIVKKEWYQNGKLHREQSSRGEQSSNGDDQPACIEYDRDGNITKEQWYQHGKLHRDGDQPAVIYWKYGKYQDESSIFLYFSDYVQRQEWYQHGKLHRDGDKPAVIYWKDGNSNQYWYQHGKLHRDGGLCALRIITSSGSVIQEGWYVHGKNTRENDLPIKIYYREDGTVLSNIWNRDTTSQNNDLPTGICYYENGAIQFKMWCKNKLFHRERSSSGEQRSSGGRSQNGEYAPALIEYDKDGNIINEEWYIHGKKTRRIGRAKCVKCVGEACPISREVFKPEDRVTQLSCGHIFGEGEINMWLRGNSTCPYCRRIIGF